MADKIIPAEKFLCKTTVETPADAMLLGYLALYLGKETEYRLSAKGLELDITSLNPAIPAFLQELEDEGFLIDASINFQETSFLSLDDFSDSFLEENSFTEFPDRLEFNNLHLKGTDSLGRSRGTIYLLAKYLFSRVYGEETRPLELSAFIQGSMFYLELLFLLTNNPLLVQSVSFSLYQDSNYDIPKKVSDLDIDYSILFYKATHLKQIQALSVPEKRALMDECGFVQGGIYVLWERAKLSNYRPQGHIKTAHVVRLDTIDDTSITLSRIFVSRTYEDLYVELKNSSQEVQENFAHSMLTKEKVVQEETFDLSSLAIGDLFSDEKYFLKEIDPLAQAESFILSDGVISKKTMLETELIYFMLLEHGIEFDLDLFASRYNLDPSWLELRNVDFTKVREKIRRNCFLIEEG